jgi:hypothetical protein
MMVTTPPTMVSPPRTAHPLPPENNIWSAVSETADQ